MIPRLAISTVQALANKFPYVAVTGPTSFTLLTSIIILVNVVVGGIGNIWGPVAGAIFLTLLPEFLPGKAGYQNILYAAIVLASLFFLPEGLVSLPDMVNRKIGWRLVKRGGSENRDA